MKRVPARAMAARPPRSRCSAAPPEEICEFFAGTPPKATNRRVCAAITSNEVVTSQPASIGMNTCGMITRPAPRL